MVHLLDFEELIVVGECEQSTIRAAQDALLRRIVDLIKDSKRVPPPDQYLDLIDEKNLIMVDPMARTYA